MSVNSVWITALPLPDVLTQKAASSVNALLVTQATELSVKVRQLAGPLASSKPHTS